MKTPIFSSFLCFLTIFLYGQGAQFTYDSPYSNTHHKLVLENEGNSTFVIEGNKRFLLNEAGQLRDILQLPFDLGGTTFGIFYYKKTTEREVFGLFSDDLEVVIYSFVGSNRDITVEGSWSKKYKSNIIGGVFGGPGLIENPEGNLVLVSHKKFQIIDKNTGEMLSDLESSVNQPAHLLKEADYYLAPASHRPVIGGIDENGLLLFNKDYANINRFIQLLKVETEYFAIGDINNHPLHNGDGFLFNLNADLDTIWTKGFPGYVFKKIVTTNDDGLAITGSKNGKVLLLKLDKAGVIEWEQTYEDGIGWEVSQMNNDNFVVAAYDPNKVYIIGTNNLGETAPYLYNYAADNAVLNINNIKHTFFSNGIHADADAPNNGFRVDSTDNYLSTLHSSGLWLSAVKNNGDVLFSGVLFKSDFEGGLLEDTNPYYQQVWQIDRRDITTFKDNFKPNLTKEEVPYSILQYPAIGNPFAKDLQGDSILIEKDFAPFVDRNNDKLYNPLDGDFPLMKGDKMVLWVMHDNTAHELSGGNGLNVNVSCRAYAYNRPEVPRLHNTIFTEMDLLNESTTDFTNLNLGLFNDIDIGCPFDDYIGSYPSGDFFYAYNNSPIDKRCLQSDEFGEKIPIQTTLFLDKKLDKFQYFLSSNSAPIYGMSDPMLTIGFYNLLNGKFSDGIPLTSGGFGYNPSETTNLTNYAFPGNPADASSWTMCRENLGDMDVRGLGISGPHNLAAGKKLTIAVAHTTFGNIPHPCPDIEPIAEELANLKEFFQKGFVGDTPISFTSDTLTKQENKSSFITASSKISKEPLNTISLKVYPVPAKDMLNIELDSIGLSGKISYRLLNNLGQEVYYKRNTKSMDPQYFAIDVSHLIAGVYTFIVEQTGHNLVVKKVLIF